MNQLPRAPAADLGFNGFTGVPADPSTSDAAEAEYARFAFHQVVDFWSGVMGFDPSPDVTFQPVDSTNESAVICSGSDKNPNGEAVDITKIGPFYCPNDGDGNKVIYWPLQSIVILPNGTIPNYGGFAEADAIAHEFGHYVQDLYGYLQPTNETINNDANAGDNAGGPR